ncbi:hypothetical protein, partial [Priestia megaterium]|uniref:hypothetical protein n=1 Tax=Priestia megaterium TaxID=1404 RepID=UPI0035B64CA4
LVLEAQEGAAAPKPATTPVSQPNPAPVQAPRAQDATKSGATAGPAASYSGGADLECDLLVLGAGPGGYSAAFRAADLGLKV